MRGAARVGLAAPRSHSDWQVLLGAFYEARRTLGLGSAPTVLYA